MACAAAERRTLPAPGRQELAGDAASLHHPEHRPGRQLVVIIIVIVGEMGVDLIAQMLEMLAFVGQHIGSALTRVRAIEETRQRNAELALVNEIGAALARQLDFEAITELVGERVRQLFQVRSIFIAIYDPATNLISWPYDIDEGERFQRDPMPLGDGMTSAVILNRRPIRVGTEERAVGPGDLVCAPAGSEHGVENPGPGRLTLLVTMAPKPR